MTFRAYTQYERALIDGAYGNERQVSTRYLSSQAAAQRLTAALRDRHDIGSMTIRARMSADEAPDPGDLVTVTEDDSGLNQTCVVIERVDRPLEIDSETSGDVTVLLQGIRALDDTGAEADGRVIPTAAPVVRLGYRSVAVPRGSESTWSDRAAEEALGQPNTGDQVTQYQETGGTWVEARRWDGDSWEPIPESATPKKGDPGTDGVAGADGSDGDDGTDGVGFEWIFARTATVTAPSAPSNAWGYDDPSAPWSDAAPNIDANNPYLWRAQRDVVGAPADGDPVADNWTGARVVGRFGPQGEQGDPGADGSTADRDFTISTFVDRGTSATWSDSAANSAIPNRITGDTVVQFRSSGGHWSQTRAWSGTAWVRRTAQVVEGDLIVDGSIDAQQALTAGTIYSPQIAAGEFHVPLRLLEVDATTTDNAIYDHLTAGAVLDGELAIQGAILAERTCYPATADAADGGFVRFGYGSTVTCWRRQGGLRPWTLQTGGQALPCLTRLAKYTVRELDRMVIWQSASGMALISCLFSNR